MKIHFYLLVAFALSVGACQMAPQTRPMTPEDHLSLESSVFDATDIVEAHILGRPAGRPVWVGDDVRVTESYQGSLKPGDRCVVAGLWADTKEEVIGADPIPVGAGDDVVLFLTKDTNPALAPYASNVMDTVDLRWIDCGRAISFCQMWSVPGPIGPDRAHAVLIDEFRRALAEHIAEVAEIRGRLSGPVDARDVPWLLREIRARQFEPAAVVGQREDVYWALIHHITELRDPQVMYEALGSFPNYPLGRGFATPEGREFLLAKLQAPDTPRCTHEELITMIGYAGINHQSVADLSIPLNASSGQGPPFEPANAAYATRVVQTALLYCDDEDFWKAFAEMLPMWMIPPKDFDDPAYRKDVSNAVALLQVYRQNHASDEQRADIDREVTRITASAQQ